MILLYEPIDFCTSKFHMLPLEPMQAKQIVDSFCFINNYKYTFNSKIKWLPKYSSQTCYFGLYNIYSILIGYCHGYYPKIHETFWIQSFMIFPEYIRQGLGTYFFNLMIKHLQTNRPLTDVYLTCYDANEGAQCFWESLGFRTLKTFLLTDDTTLDTNNYSLFHLSL